MRSLEQREENGITGLRPYHDLYIYLFNGFVREEDETYLGDAFLGNWVEDQCSFLFFARPADKIMIRLLEMRPDLELVGDYHFTYEER